MLDENGAPITTMTDENGHYAFTVPLGEWSVQIIDVPEGYGFTTPNAGDDDAADSDVPGLNIPTAPVAITWDNLVNHTLDAGLVGSVTVGDYVWMDTDYDGVQDRGEPGIAGVVLTITGPDGLPVTDVDGNPVGPETTDTNGKYSFENLPVLPEGQSYTVTVATPEGYLATKAGVGDRATDSSTGSASSQGLTLPGDRDSTLDFGFVPLGEIGDYIWFDTDRDGVQDVGENPVPGVVLQLVDENGTPVVDENGNPVTTVTDENGWYSFTVPIGTWSVQVIEIPEGYAFTTPNAGGDDALDSDATGLHIPFGFVTITPDNLVNHTLDAGLVATVSVGDFIWFDTDKDGVQDAGEPGIPDVWVVVYGPDGKIATDVWGNEIAPVKTDKDGHYLFENLPVLTEGQSYTVRIDRERTLKDNPAFQKFAPTASNAGGRDIDSDQWEANSQGLTGAGESDLSLDFGFVTTSPVIDIEKGDANGNDADTADESVALSDGSTDLVFVVTNFGDEDLIDIRVADEIVTGSGTVSALTGTLADGTVVGPEWAGPLAPGASITYTATLSGVVAGEKHLDTASVAAEGRWTGVPVTDEDEYNAHTPNPGIDVEKLDVAGNDADTEKETVTVSGSTQNLVFVVTNTGDEALRDVTVSDEIIKGGAAVQSLVCTFPRGRRV